MTQPSLTAAILRHKAEWYTYLALTIEAEERGDSSDDIPCPFDPTADPLAAWERAADSLPEAMEALKLAIADYDAGDTPRIPAMMKAAFGWLDAEYKRRNA